MCNVIRTQRRQAIAAEFHSRTEPGFHDEWCSRVRLSDTRTQRYQVRGYIAQENLKKEFEMEPESETSKWERRVMKCSHPTSWTRPGLQSAPHNPLPVQLFYQPWTLHSYDSLLMIPQKCMHWNVQYFWVFSVRWTYFYFGRGSESEKYCDKYVCVCLYVCLSGTRRAIFTTLFVLVAYGRGSVLLRHRCDTLCTSGFMDEVIFL